MLRILRFRPTLRELLMSVTLTTGILTPAAAQVHSESVFSVVTRKGGVAGRLAHNHLVVAETFLAELTFDASAPHEALFRFSTTARELSIDDPDRVRALEPRIRELGVVQDLAYPSDDQRNEIREKMLHKDQLDADNFPVLSAELLSVTPVETVIGAQPFTHQALVAVTIHGVTVERTFAARYEEEDAALRMEAIGSFRFREFDIDPYSAFLGTVKVKDEFEIYVDFRWTPVGGGNP